MLTLIQFQPAYDILALLALSGAPLNNVSIENVNFPHMQACTLPCLRKDDQTFIQQPFVLSFIKKHYANIDAGLPSAILADIIAYSGLIQGDLKDALDIARYDDDEHYRKVTFPTLIKAMPFPFNYFQARQMRKDAIKAIASRNPHYSHGQNNLKWAQSFAKDCYKAISEKMGASKWLLNTASPTSLDALFFGHLCEAKFQPGCNTLLDEFSNLQIFYDRTLARLRRSKFMMKNNLNFPGPELELHLVNVIPTALARNPVIAKLPAEEPVGPPSPGNEGTLQAVFFTLFVVLSYIGWNNLVAIEIRQSDDVEETEN